MVQPFPAPSLRELLSAAKLRECRPMVAPGRGFIHIFIDSVISERLRSSKYTPSVSHSLDSSLREGAGNGRPPFNVPPGNRNVAGDFHRPYETQKFLHSTIHRGTFPFIGGAEKI